MREESAKNGNWKDNKSKPIAKHVQQNAPKQKIQPPRPNSDHNSKQNVLSADYIPLATAAPLDKLKLRARLSNKYSPLNELLFKGDGEGESWDQLLDDNSMDYSDHMDASQRKKAFNFMKMTVLQSLNMTSPLPTQHNASHSPFISLTSVPFSPVTLLYKKTDSYRALIPLHKVDLSLYTLPFKLELKGKKKLQLSLNKQEKLKKTALRKAKAIARRSTSNSHVQPLDLDALQWRFASVPLPTLLQRAQYFALITPIHYIVNLMAHFTDQGQNLEILTHDEAGFSVDTALTPSTEAADATKKNSKDLDLKDSDASEDTEVSDGGLQRSKLAFKVNTDKTTKKMSALLRGLPPSKRTKWPEVVKDDAQTLPNYSTFTEVPATSAILHPMDIRSSMDLMTTPIRDLHLSGLEKISLEKNGTFEATNPQSSLTKDSDH
ncbi:hypothetical protein LguiA_006948 [Lonicera macranthoides]